MTDIREMKILVRMVQMTILSSRLGRRTRKNQGT